MSETATIATGAPRHGHDDEAIGYFYSLSLTSTPPANAKSSSNARTSTAFPEK